MSWQLIPVHFRGPTELDILAFRSSDGAFAKWYGGDFVITSDYQPVQYIGNQPGRWTDAQLIPIDFDNDGNVDVLAFHPSDGGFAKWYSDGTVRPDFNYQPVQYIGNQPGRWTDAQLIPIDFDGNGRMDILAFRPSDGAFAKWYNDGTVGPSFNYQPVQYIGNQPGRWTDAKLIPINFNGAQGDKSVDVLAFRPSDGAFAKWYSDGTVRPDFLYQPVQYIGGQPGTWTDAQLIPIDFDGDGNVDVLAFRPSDGAFAKWYSIGVTRTPDFHYQPVRYIGGKPGTWSGAKLIPADFNGDGNVDILAFLPDAVTKGDQSLSYVAKWFSDKTVGPDFNYHRVLEIGGTGGGSTPSLDLIPVDLDGDGSVDFLAFFPNTDVFTRWLEKSGGVPVNADSFAIDADIRVVGGGVFFHNG